MANLKDSDYTLKKLAPTNSTAQFPSKELQLQ